MKEFERASFLFKHTGGTHSCGLYDKHGGLCHVLFEDTGRLNAVDKVVGHCLAHDIDARDKMLLVSGRVSAELVTRAISLHVPVLVSPSAPTDRAIELGEEEGITIVGFVREERMNVYSHIGRVL
jgi:FdhD protein